MALFGPKDADLPILTKFYQAEGEEELWQLVWGDNPPPFTEKEMARLRWLHSITRQLMQQCLQGTFERRLITALAGYESRYPSHIAVLNKLEEGADPLEIISLPEIVTGEDLYRAINLQNPHYPIEVLEARVASSLSDMLLRRRDMARSCEECYSVFFAGRKDHVFCSKRCNDRVFGRRRREKEKVKSGFFGLT